MADTSSRSDTPAEPSSRGLGRIVLSLVMFFAIMVALLFGSAGRLDLPFFWAWLGIMATAVVVSLFMIDPGLREERIKPGPGGTDRSLRLWMMPFLIAHLVVAGFDVGRFDWSDAIPVYAQVAGLTLGACGFAGIIWAISANRFFSPVVRVQSERGHHVIDRGPYAVVRHPGYAFMTLVMLGGGLALGSWTALAILAGPCALLIRRLLIEDRYLHEHLDGYREYAARVRSRLLPGLW